MREVTARRSYDIEDSLSLGTVRGLLTCGKSVLRKSELTIFSLQLNIWLRNKTTFPLQPATRMHSEALCKQPSSQTNSVALSPQTNYTD
jgi:hypothetical protein